MYATNTYCMLQNDHMGNAPVPLVYIVPVCKSANAAKQNMLLSVHSSLVGWRQLVTERAWRIAGCCVRVPLSVAVDGGRCWRIR
jgi:hypothetical protein